MLRLRVGCHAHADRSCHVMLHNLRERHLRCLFSVVRLHGIAVFAARNVDVGKRHVLTSLCHSCPLSLIFSCLLRHSVHIIGNVRHRGVVRLHVLTHGAKQQMARRIVGIVKVVV